MAQSKLADAEGLQTQSASPNPPSPASSPSTTRKPTAAKSGLADAAAVQAEPGLMIKRSAVSEKTSSLTTGTPAVAQSNFAEAAAVQTESGLFTKRSDAPKTSSFLTVTRSNMVQPNLAGLHGPPMRTPFETMAQQHDRRALPSIEPR